MVLLTLAGVLFCVSYLYLANKYCPGEQPGPNLNWRLIPDLDKNEKHDRAAYRYGRKKNEGHSVSADLPPSYIFATTTAASTVPWLLRSRRTAFILQADASGYDAGSINQLSFLLRLVKVAKSDSALTAKRAPFVILSARFCLAKACRS
jgi:hypothetical protein